MWRQQLKPSGSLETLGKLAVRLIRIAMYQKLRNGEAQLKAEGIDVPLLDEYKIHAQKTVRISKRKRRESGVTFIHKGDF